MYVCMHAYMYVCMYAVSRFRVLPPLEESLLRGLMRLSIAVLDSYPVGMHIQILEAMLDGIPVVHKTYTYLHLITWTYLFYIHIFLYIHICIHTYIYIHRYIRTYMRIHKYMYIHTYIKRICIHTFISCLIVFPIF